MVLISWYYLIIVRINDKSFFKRGVAIVVIKSCVYIYMLKHRPSRLF